MRFLFIILSTIFIYSCTEKGCTDPDALNYSILANKDDGSCEYCQTIIDTYVSVNQMPLQFVFQSSSSLPYNDSILAFLDLTISQEKKSDLSCEFNNENVYVQGKLTGNIHKSMDLSYNTLSVRYYNQLGENIQVQYIPITTFLQPFETEDFEDESFIFLPAANSISRVDIAFDNVFIRN